MKIALATCSSLPHGEVDDRPLHDALCERGVSLVHPAWDDPAFEWNTCDAVLIRTTWDYQERLDEFLAWARRIADVVQIFNPLPVIEWNTNKVYLRDLEKRGALTVPTIWLAAGSQLDLKSVLSERGWDHAFLKPAIGATSRETLRFRADAAGLATANAHLSRLLVDETMLLQPYLASVEREGELSLIFIDGTFSHALRKIPLPGDYRVQDDFGAHDEPVAASSEEISLARSIFASVEHDLLYGRADFLRDDTGTLRLTELELVEPSMFFRHDPSAAARLAEALLRRVLRA